MRFLFQTPQQEIIQIIDDITRVQYLSGADGELYGVEFISAIGAGYNVAVVINPDYEGEHLLPETYARNVMSAIGALIRAEDPSYLTYSHGVEQRLMLTLNEKVCVQNMSQYLTRMRSEN